MIPFKLNDGNELLAFGSGTNTFGKETVITWAKLTMIQVKLNQQ